MNRIRANLIAGPLFAVYSGVLFWNSFNYPEESAGYVRFILALLFACSVLLTFIPDRKNAKVIKELVSPKKLAAAGLILAYIILMPRIGFFVTSFLFILGFMFTFNPKKPILYLVVSTVFCGIVFVSFRQLLRVEFPSGWLF